MIEMIRSFSGNFTPATLAEVASSSACCLDDSVAPDRPAGSRPAYRGGTDGGLPK